ncbi:MAG: hypothetical protein GX791_04615 [Synergistaceae bacterium]|nr:hypothetical protein [Synergistaceae bacterium]
MAGTKVYERNTAEDHVYWKGILDLPELTEEVFSSSFHFTDDRGDFEACLEEWWPEFISDFSL